MSQRADIFGHAGEFPGTDGTPPCFLQVFFMRIWRLRESGPDFGETAFGGAQLCGSAFSTRTNEGECCWSWAIGMAPSMAEDTASVKSAGGAGSRHERARNTPVIWPYTGNRPVKPFLEH